MQERRRGGLSRRSGAGDYDLPYVFGALPTVDRPHPFGLRQYARLLIMRGRWQDEPDSEDQDGRYSFTEHQGIIWVERDGSTYLSRPMEPS